MDGRVAYGGGPDLWVLEEFKTKQAVEMELAARPLSAFVNRAADRGTHQPRLIDNWSRVWMKITDEELEIGEVDSRRKEIGEEVAKKKKKNQATAGK